MPRKSEGYIFLDKELKRWIARITWWEGAKQRNRKRNCRTKAEAQLALEEFRREIAKIKAGGVPAPVRPITFREAADSYQQLRLIPARWVDGRRVAGLVNTASPRQIVSLLVERFGSRLLSSISRADLEQFRLDRLGTPTRLGKQRTINTINKELGVLRSILRFAVGEGWLERSPFESGRLIQRTLETKRNRVLSLDEEARLLAACTGRRAHLWTFFVAALDTAARRKELFGLAWDDVDWVHRIVTIRSSKGRGGETRRVGLTPRLYDALLQLHRDTENPTGPIWGSFDPKRGFAGACRDAGISGLNFHDFRHTSISRMVAAGIPFGEIMKRTGHKQLDTFLIYVNPEADRDREAAERLEEWMRRVDRLESNVVS